MKLEYILVSLAIASLTDAAPVKRRGFLDDLFGFDTPTTTAVAAAVPTAAPIAAAPATTPVAVAAPVAAAVPTTTSKVGFWAGLFGGGDTTPKTTAVAAAPAAVPTTAQPVANPVVTAAPAAAPVAAPVAAPAATTASSGGFLGNLFKDWFGSSSSTAAAAPVAAAPAAPTPVVATSAQVYTSVVTQPPAAAPAAVPTTSAAPVLSDSNPYVGGDLFSLLFGSSSSPTSAAAGAAPAAAAPAVQSAAAGGYASPAATGASNPIHGSGSGTESGYTFSTSIVTGSTLGKSFQGGGTATGSVNQATVTVSGSSAGATAGVGAKGITYSPYTDQDNCKSADQVARDIKLLSNYDVIRLYSTDCQGIENVLAAMNSNQQIYLGVWNIESPMGELQDIVNAISQNSRGWSAVHTIAIGNERVNSGEATVAQVQQAVDTARQFLKSNSYTGPIVTVDTLVAYVANPQLCQMSDYLAVNCHPYWDGGVQPSNSGPWLLQQIANLQSVCGTEKDVLITESGWPTQGDPYGQCVPSVPNQVAAVKSIVSSLADRVILFTMYNDYWKFSIGGAGPYGVEYYWGLFGNSPE